MNRNKICLNLKVIYILKLFNHSLIQSFIPFLEFPASVRQRRTALTDTLLPNTLPSGTQNTPKYPAV